MSGRAALVDSNNVEEKEYSMRWMYVHEPRAIQKEGYQGEEQARRDRLRGKVSVVIGTSHWCAKNSSRPRAVLKLNLVPLQC